MIKKVRLFSVTSFFLKVNIYFTIQHLHPILALSFDTQIKYKVSFISPTVVVFVAHLNSMKSIIDAIFSYRRPYAGKVKSSENVPFNNEAYSAFKRGNVVKGILCPSLTNSFRARSLERSYLTYSHRQRQKSLLIVNIVDLMLKIVLAIVWTCRKSSELVCVLSRISLTVFMF